MARQGDILIIPASAIPKGATKMAKPVLAEGEVTGHAHVAVLDRPAIEEWQKSSISGFPMPVLEPEVFVDPRPGATADAADRWLRASTPVVIRHEEHAPITLPAGIYRVIRQVEHDPVRSRVVAD